MKRQIVVFSGRSNPTFAQHVCDKLNTELGRLEVIRFSDGELSVEIGDNVRGRDVFIIQSTSTPGNDHLMELLISIDALKRASAWRITAVMPYFGYSRQDRKLKPRVPITAKLVANLLTTAGASRVLTLDLHAGQIMGFFDIPVDNLQPLPALVPYVKKQYGNEELVIVSPDVGGVERARNFSSRLPGSSLAIIDKRRSGPNLVAEMRVVGDVRSKTCILVDDMIDTGGTIVKACEMLLENGAQKVLTCCVHPVMSGNCLERLHSSPLHEVIVTDSIQVSAAGSPKLKILSVAPVFAEAIRRIHSEDSISSLFR
jgi:ribose-phosphate pyrophosphokinase